MNFEILGQPFSKANSRRLVSFHGKFRSIKSAKALDYETAAVLQFQSQRKVPTIETPVGVEITIYYPDRRQDLDPSLILDIMQKAEIYRNDRQVEEMHLFRRIDKQNPRSIIRIWKLAK